MVDEHGDRAPHDAAHREHLLEHVAAWIFEVDEDHVGVDANDLGQQRLHLADDDDVLIAAVAQARRDDRAAGNAFIDDGDAG
jgi:hypothetical protein